MKPVDQSIVNEDIGDCMRAATASLFELELDQVPHFARWSDDEWFDVFLHFVRGIGYEHIGNNAITSPFRLFKKYSVGGYYYASVPSKTLDGVSHAVIINLKGRVVHDPNPNKRWQGCYPIKTGLLHYVYQFEKIKKKSSKTS